MCRSCGGTRAASRSYVEGAMCCAGAYDRPLGGARQAPLPRSMQALAQWLHGGGAAWGGCFPFRLVQAASVFPAAGSVGHLGGLPQLRARPLWRRPSSL